MRSNALLPAAQTKPPPLNQNRKPEIANLSRRHALRTALCSAGMMMPVRTIKAATIARPATGMLEPPFKTRPDLIVAGQEDGRLAKWGHLIGETVNRMLPSELPLSLTYIGGSDGVTAANQFEARSQPDGATALLISGETAMASLRGDGRAQYDPGHWLPIATGLTSGVVIGRQAQIPRSKILRLAATAPLELALVAKLGLSLLATDVFDTVESSDPLFDLMSGQVDFVFLHGSDALTKTTEALKLGAAGMFTLGLPDEAGLLQRDPRLASIPTLTELLATRPSTAEAKMLTPAWRAVAASAQLEFALVLPWLTPSGAVAWWRKAMATLSYTSPSSSLATAPQILKPNSTVDLRIEPAYGFGLTALALDANASLAFKRWLLAQPK